MKKEVIQLGIKTPVVSKYAGNNDTAMAAFIVAVCGKIGLPDNWKNYFSFKNTSDFIVLQEKGYYNSQRFRRFKKREDATISQENIDSIFEYIKTKDEIEKQNIDKIKRTEYFENLLSPICTAHTNDEWAVRYGDNNTGLTIVLKDADEKIQIRHNGMIPAPQFFMYRNYISIKEAQEWLNENQLIHEKLVTKANEIKEQLPKEFFDLPKI